MTPLYEFYLATHNIHNGHPCPYAGFEPATPASERPQTHVLEGSATGTGTYVNGGLYFFHTEAI